MLYNNLIEYLQGIGSINTSVKSNYIVISFKRSSHHITIFKDQWDDYTHDMTSNNGRYHLFHISSNKETNKCSTYFWVDRNTLAIKEIPSRYFKYEQPSYDFNSSTRRSCENKNVYKILYFFQKILFYIKGKIKYLKKLKI